MLLQLFKDHWNGLGIQGKVLLAVSGGEDSMVMADLFRQCGLDFGVAHCNFGLRGAESDLDEQLVRDWCTAHSVAFHTVRFDTKHKAQEWRKGIQETARILRYEWFDIIRASHGYVRLATAHHANDNVETLFINLLKGTGISGLHGIPAENGTIVRPLLFATKDMIAAYAGGYDIVFREDASNASDDYLRNAIRHKIIPVAEELVPGAVVHISQSIGRFGQAEQLYRKAIEQERKKLVEQRGQDHYIPVLKLLKRVPLETICYELIKPFGFSAAQVPHMLDLMHAESGRYILSATHRMLRNRDFLIITTLPDTTADMVLVEAVPCTIHTGKYAYSFAMQDRPKVIPQGADEAYIDMALVQFPLVLRTIRTGDYLYPLGMKMKKKKVSKLLIDEKVPLHSKEEIRILECGKRIAWVSGIRLDERFKIKEGTSTVLVVKRSARPIADE